MADGRAGAGLLARVALLGFASGLPLALVDTTLQAWLTFRGEDLRTLGWVALIGLPYALKFAWAPLLDRPWQGWPGRRRGWMLVGQLGCAAALFALASGAGPGLVALLALAGMLALLSATQDIAIDAWRADVLPARSRGLGAALGVAGYRIALLVAGGGALLLAERIGFGPTYAVMGGLMLAVTAVTLASPEPEVAPAPADGGGYLAPFRRLLDRDAAVLLLLLVCTYKLGDAVAGRMTIPFLLREIELSLTELGVINKGLGLVAAISGGVLGGVLLLRWSLVRCLVVFGLLQALTNVGFLMLAVGGGTLPAVATVLALEQVAGGMGTAAFLALLMAMTERRYSAAQFATLTALASVARLVAGPLGGEVAAAAGWPLFFALSVAAALPGLVLAAVCARAITALDCAREGAGD